MYIDKRLFVALIVVITAVLCYSVIQEGHSWGGDFSLYINQAIHLADKGSVNELYQWNKVSMQSSSHEIGPYLYPNGFPLLLAPVYKLFGVNFKLMKWLCALSFLLTIPLIFTEFKNRFNTVIYPIVITCLIAFNYDVIIFIDNVLSDFPFWFFCMLTFYLMRRNNTLLNQILLGLCAFYAYFIRDIGLFLIPTIFVFQFVNSHKYFNNNYLRLIPFAVFCLFFLLNKAIFPNGGENHLNMLINGLSLSLIKHNLEYYLNLLAGLFTIEINRLFFGILIIAVAIIGVFKGLKHNLHYVVFVALCMAMLLVWPSQQGPRFMFPVLPFVFYFLVNGLLVIFSTINVPAKFQKYLLAAGIVVFSYYSINKIKGLNYNSNHVVTPEINEVFNYVATAETKDKIVGFIKPRVLYLFTGVKSIVTDFNHFDNSIADYYLVYKYDGLDISNYQLVKAFDNYVLIERLE